MKGKQAARHKSGGKGQASAGTRAPGGASALAAHAIIFIGIMPFALYGFDQFLKRNFLLYHKLLEPELLGVPWNLILGVAFALLGLCLYAWALRVQLSHGKPTPFSTLPFRKLLAVPPYDMCRNPAALGALLFYSGLGFSLNSLAYLLTTLAFGVIAVLYLKFVEEPAIAERFGKEYDGYRKRTPFMLPGI